MQRRQGHLALFVLCAISWLAETTATACASKVLSSSRICYELDQDLCSSRA